MTTPDYLVIAAYLLGMLALGVYFRDNDSESDYFLGKGGFGWFPIGLSVLATQLSAVSFISAPAFVGARAGGGMVWTSTELHAPLTMLVLMVLLIPPLYRSGVISIYAFLERRLGRSSRRLVSSVFLVNRALATGIAIYTVCLVLETTLGIGFWYGLLFIGVITTIYSWQGGMRAVIYGDAAQMIILFVGLFICAYYALDAQGGVGEWRAELDPARLVALDFDAVGIGGDGDFGFWPLLIGGLFISVAYYGTDQSEAQRFLSSRDLPTLRQSLLFVGLVRYPVMALYALTGLIVGPLLLANAEFAEIIRADPDRMIPLFIVNYLPAGVRGILVVAILAAAMSSLSSAINSLSAVTVEGYLKALYRAGAAAGASGGEPEATADPNPGPATEPVAVATDGRPSLVLLSRVSSLVWGVVILLVASLVGGANETLIVVIAQIGSISFGPILALFVLAILLPRARAGAANLGLLAGIALNLFLWLVVGEQLFWIWWNVTGFALSLAVGYLGSRLYPDTGRAEELDLRPDWAALRSREAVVLYVWFFLMLGASFGWSLLG